MGWYRYIGCATGASHEVDISAAAKFCLEIVKEYGAGRCQFYNPDEFLLLQNLYGSMHGICKACEIK